MPREGCLLMRAGDACNHDPPLTNTLQVWRLSPSMGLHSGQGRSRTTNISPRALSGRHSAKYASYVHCVYKGSCRTTSLDSNTRTRCARVWSQSDSCGPLVRRSKYLRVPPNHLACYTAEAQKNSTTNSGNIDTYTRDPAKDRPPGSSDDRPDNG